MIEKIHPYCDRVIIELIHQENKSKSGILIPDSAKEKSTRGKIIWKGDGRVGDDGKIVPMKCNVGDTIIFNKFAGTEIDSGDKQYLVIRDSDILATIAH